MLLVTCNSCHTQAFTNDHGSPDQAVECDCCPESHDHGWAANKTGDICRPVTITVCPGSVSMQVM